MVQRRLHKRVPKQILIKCKNGALSFDGLSLDICPGGVFVVTGNLLPPKSAIDIELWLDEDSPVHCVGEVTWVNRGQVIHYPPGFGVQFIDLMDTSMDCLLKLCLDQDQDGCAIPW